MFTKSSKCLQMFTKINAVWEQSCRICWKGLQKGQVHIFVSFTQYKTHFFHKACNSYNNYSIPISCTDLHRWPNIAIDMHFLWRHANFRTTDSYLASNLILKILTTKKLISTARKVTVFFNSFRGQLGTPVIYVFLIRKTFIRKRALKTLKP